MSIFMLLAFETLKKWALTSGRIGVLKLSWAGHLLAECDVMVLLILQNILGFQEYIF